MLKDAYFILGIGGMGMSALANYLLDRGDPVEGTDREYFRGRCLALARRGLRVHPQGSGGLTAFVAAHPDRKIRVLASPAVEAEVPEMVAAKELGLAVVRRPDFLAGLFNAAPHRVAVVGSAGKTTTSALLAHILVACGKDPSYAIGGFIGDAPNGRCGRSGLFLAEADESDGSVVNYRPDLVLFTNLFPEHKPLEELRANFRTMFAGMPEGGRVLYSEMDPALGLSSPRNMSPVQGTLNPWSAGGEILEIQYGKKRYRIPLAGNHNYRNVELAVAGAHHLGVGFDDALKSLERFPGVEHRMAKFGEAAGVRVFCDFAHAPREIKASYESSTALGRRVVYVYQPHGFGPTHLQREPLVETFAAMRPEDALVLTDIYYGGGTVERLTTGRGLFDLVAARHADTHFVESLDDLPETVAILASPGDVVTLAGSRTIFDSGDKVLAALAGLGPAAAAEGPWM